MDAARPRASTAARLVSVAGELLITVGVLVLLFLAWELWWTGLDAERDRDDAADELFSNLEQLEPHDPGEGTGVTLGDSGDSEGSGGSGDGSGDSEGGSEGSGGSDGGAEGGGDGGAVVPEPENMRRFIEDGQVMAMLYSPRLGSDWAAPVREGVDDAQLNTAGLGHYPSTQLPGEPGNFAMAGHRQTYGHVLWDQDALQAGDRIYVQSPDGYYTYAVRSTEIVDPGDSEVLAEAPGSPGEANDDTSWLTLTTCHPPYTTLQRMVTHAELVDHRSLDAGAPEAIADQVAELARADGSSPFASGDGDGVGDEDGDGDGDAGADGEEGR